MAKRREARCPGCAKTKDVDRQTALLRVESTWCQMPNIIPSEHDGPMRKRALAGHDDWFWACDACISSKRAIVADVEKQVMGLGTPCAAYVDRPFRCEDCDADSVFSAKEQRHWFEKLGFFVGVYPKQCAPCRRARRRKKRAQKALMETLAGLDPHDRKQLEAAARLYRELGIEKKATALESARHSLAWRADPPINAWHVYFHIYVGLSREGAETRMRDGGAVIGSGRFCIIFK